MGMCVDHGIHVGDRLAYRLLAKIGSGVDHHVLSRVADHHRGTCAAVFGVRGVANGARTSQSGDAHRRTTSQNGQCCLHFFTKGLGTAPGAAGCTRFVSAFVISTYAICTSYSEFAISVSSCGVKLPLVFSRSSTSVSIVWRAPSMSTRGCPPCSCSNPICISAVMYSDAMNRSKLIWNSSELRPS